MYRAIPVSNKLIERKSQERSRERHQKKLQELKPNPPVERKNSFTHNQRTIKRQITDEEKNPEIRLDNQLLLNPLENMMKKKISKEFINEQYNEQKARVRSLNRDSRKRQLVKITVENQFLLKRLQSQKSAYNVQQWLEAHRQEQKYLQNISEYPIKLYANYTPRVSGDIETTISPRIMTDRQPRSTLDLMKNPRSVSPINSTPRSPANELAESPIKLSQPDSTPKEVKKGSIISAVLDTKRDDTSPTGANLPLLQPKRVLFQAKKQFGGSFYLVQFYIQNRMFKIIASNIQKSGLKLFSAPEKEEKYNNNFEAIMSRLKFRGTQIIFATETEDTRSSQEKDVQLPTLKDQRRETLALTPMADNKIILINGVSVGADRATDFKQENKKEQVQSNQTEEDNQAQVFTLGNEDLDNIGISPIDKKKFFD